MPKNDFFSETGSVFFVFLFLVLAFFDFFVLVALALADTTATHL
jgi:hypothetical protein